MRRLLYTALAIVSVASCAKFHHPHFKDVLELVPQEKTTYVDKNGGDASLKIYSNGNVSARMLVDTLSWVQMLSEPSFKGDNEVALSFEPNESFRRMVQVEVSLDGGRKLDTLNFYQHGLEPQLACHESFAAIDGSAGGQVSFPIITNIAPEDILISYDYISGDSGWISDVTWDEENITLAVSSSSSNAVSISVVTLSYPDGWKEDISAELRVTRSAADGSFGKIASFADVRMMASEGQVAIDEDVLIEGMVISSCDSPNMELNPSVAYDEVDIEENDRTAYIQSLDASLGFRIKFDDPQDNVLVPGSQLKMTLKGTVLTRETAPERYTISSVESSNIIGGIYGVAIPEKVKSISGLVPEDIYTYVEIENTEFVNKNGSYANVREDYTLTSDFNLSKVQVPMDGWASLLIDGRGDAIYAMVNMMCPWRRTGDGVPQGAGSVRGIIVHHDHNRYGDMGDYQIRVLDEEGFSMEDEASYSEYLKWNGKTVAKDYTGSKVTPYVNESTDEATLYLENTSSSVVGNTGMLRPVQSYEKLTTDSNSTVSGGAIGLQVMLEGWYEQGQDGQMLPKNGVRAEFSTSDLSESNSLAAYVSCCASGTIGDPSTFKNYPLHWCLEYSLDGTQYKIVPPAANPDKQYVHMRTSPWTPGYVGSVNYLTSAYAGLGFTDHVFALPAEVLGQQKVYVRFRPYDTYMASLPIEWYKDIETSRVASNTSYKNDIRFAQITFLVK